jgi:hypothetical protein
VVSGGVGAVYAGGSDWSCGARVHVRVKQSDSPYRHARVARHRSGITSSGYPNRLQGRWRRRWLGRWSCSWSDLVVAQRERSESCRVRATAR